MTQASKIFVFIAQALEAVTLQGQTGFRVAAAARVLIEASSIDPAPLLQQFSEVSRRNIMEYFG
jgi:importin-5